MSAIVTINGVQISDPAIAAAVESLTAERAELAQQVAAITLQRDQFQHTAENATRECSRLSSEVVSKLITERDEADRRAGAAERHMESLKEDSRRRSNWLWKAKQQWGVSDNVSFDVVWDEALKLKARVAELEPDAVMMKKIDGLTNLEPGWDGYRGVPLPARTAEKAKEIFRGLPPLNWQVVPGGDGSVQFEYHGEEWDIEVSIIDAAREVKP